MLCARMMKGHPEIAQAVAQRFSMIIVDEAQDTSAEQMTFFEILCNHGFESIDFVGDPDQAIYEWRNASPGYLLEKIGVDGWNTLYLTENRRCSQFICNATAAFSQRLTATGISKAVGVSMCFPQKPQLFLASPDASSDSVEQCFFSKCRE